MSRRVPNIICACLLSALLVSPAAAFKRTKSGADLKEFQLETAAGETVSLATARGEKATLIVFWAIWNPRSTQLLDDLQPLYAEHAAGGFQIVAINAENAEWSPETREQVAKTVADYGLTYPVVIDPDLAVYNDYGVVAMPSIVLADGEGRIVALQEGYPTAARLEIRDQVLIALGLLEPAPAGEVAVSKEQLVDPKVRRKVEMGRLLVKRRRPSRAVKVLEQAIAEDPTFAEAYRVLAAALDAMEREADAQVARAKLAELEQPVETAAAAPMDGDPPIGEPAEEPAGAASTPTEGAR